VKECCKAEVDAATAKLREELALVTKQRDKWERVARREANAKQPSAKVFDERQRTPEYYPEQPSAPTPDLEQVIAKIEGKCAEYLRKNPLGCPFPSCVSRGEPSSVRVEERGGGFVAECQECCGGTGSFDTPERALDEWNAVARFALLCKPAPMPDVEPFDKLTTEQIAREIVRKLCWLHDMHTHEDRMVDFALPALAQAVRQARDDARAPLVEALEAAFVALGELGDAYCGLNDMTARNAQNAINAALTGTLRQAQDEAGEK